MNFVPLLHLVKIPGRDLLLADPNHLGHRTDLLGVGKLRFVPELTKPILIYVQTPTKIPTQFDNKDLPARVLACLLLHKSVLVPLAAGVVEGEALTFHRVVVVS